VDFTEDPDHRAMREAVREVCARFPDKYRAEREAHARLSAAELAIRQEMVLNFLAEHVLGLPRSY